MKYLELSAKQARQFSNLLIPGLTEDPDFESFLFLAAADEAVGILGLAVVDPQITGPELLSIGVSSAHQRKRIGSDLFYEMLARLQFAYADLLAGGVMALRVQESRDAGDWEGLDAFLRYVGFKIVEQSDAYTCKVREFLAQPVVKRYAAAGASKGLLSLAELPERTLRQFNGLGVYAPVTRTELDGESSVFLLDEDGRIKGCVLNARTGEQAYENCFVYMEPNFEDKKALVAMLARSAGKMAEQASGEAALSALPVNEAGRKLAAFLFAGMGGSSEQYRSYEHVLTEFGTFFREDAA